jgi:hypothetical protein
LDVWIRRWKRREDRFRETKGLGQDRFRRFREPVVQVESRSSSIEIPIIESEKILVLVIQTLNGMRLTFGKVPDIAEAKFGDLVAAFFIDGGDEDTAEEDLTPFCHTVPM